MAPLVVDKEKKKKKILEAAKAVFAKKGYRNTRVADIADFMGIGKGTIYEYFKSKEDLFLELFKFVKKNPINLQSINWPPDATPPEKLKIFILTSIKSYHQLEDFVLIISDFKAENRCREGNINDKFQFRKMYRNFRRGITSIIEEGIKDGTFKEVESNYIASIIIAVIEGFMFQWLYDRREFSLKKMGLLLTEMILNNIKNTEGKGKNAKD